MMVASSNRPHQLSLLHHLQLLFAAFQFVWYPLDLLVAPGGSAPAGLAVALRFHELWWVWLLAGAAVLYGVLVLIVRRLEPERRRGQVALFLFAAAILLQFVRLT